MAVRIPWDKYEASLLLDYCIKVENGEVSRTEAISIVSQILRQRAVSAGHEIDEVFRNENGISMQFSAMRNCYLGKNHGLTISKLFYKTVELQKNNPNEFYKLLREEFQLYTKSLQEERISASYKADQKEQTAEDAENSDRILKVDFNVIQSYAHTKPIYCAYKNQPINLSGWNAIFHALVQLIYRDYRDNPYRTACVGVCPPG